VSPAAARGFANAHPAWWCGVLSVVAWVFIVRHAIAHWGHAHHHVMPLPTEEIHWVLMVVAMMMPLAIGTFDRAALRGLWRRRARSVLLVLAGYLAPWAIAGIPVSVVRGAPLARTYAAAGVAFVLAAAWTWVPFYATARRACHRAIPLAPRGVRADVDCLRYGVAFGLPCVVTCWPLMAACSLTGHALPAMVGGFAIGAMDRWSFRRPRRLVFASTLGLAALYLALAASQ
jgi:predicted metal-binding membrane protein